MNYRIVYPKTVLYLSRPYMNQVLCRSLESKQQSRPHIPFQCSSHISLRGRSAAVFATMLRLKCSYVYALDGFDLLTRLPRPAAIDRDAKSGRRTGQVVQMSTAIDCKVIKSISSN